MEKAAIDLPAGTLYVVATPIGNIDDMTPRAREVLAGVDVVAAEDTRHSGRLLQRFGIRTSMVSLHEHNEAARVPELLARLLSGENVALISDAGTPLVSDPGYRLLRASRDSGIRVSPIPGASAATALLSVAGLPAARFVFEGFLPARGSARRRRLEALADEPRAIVLFESPRRVRESLADMVQVLGGEREATLGRELTKLHEVVRHGSLAELATLAADDDSMRMGEIAIVVAGAPELAEDERDHAEARRVLELLLADGLSPRQSAALAGRIAGGSRNALYRLALTLSQTADDTRADGS
jgi:16S rRNA (cytidine1402-2'-O)-methyltransferase